MKNSAITLFAALAFGIAPNVLSASLAQAAALYDGVIVSAPAGDDQVVYEINVQTGEVVKADASQLTKIPDSAPLPSGDYHFYLAEAPDLKTFWLYRMDRSSGRVWFLSAGTNWVESALPK